MSSSLLFLVLLCLGFSSCCCCDQSLEQRLAAFDDHLQAKGEPSLFAPILSNFDILGSKSGREVVGKRITPAAVEACYDGELNGTDIQLFSANVSTFQVLTSYYKSLPSKTVTLESIEALIAAARAITRHVVACSVKRRSYKLGFTNISDKSPEEFRRLLTGYDASSSSSSNRGGDKIGSFQNSSSFTSARLDSVCLPPRSLRPPSSLDWSTQGLVTPVRHQYQCASCWAFAVTAALESAYLRYHKKRLDLSEQQLVDCSSSNWEGGESGSECQTGTAYTALRYIYLSGLALESSWPYRAQWQGCPAPKPQWAAALRSFCVRGLTNYGSSSFTSWERLSEAEMERAVAHFGPVTVCLNSDRLQHYKGGVFNADDCPLKLTHMVLLVGYTADAWILKNSWGTKWGERGGYFRLARGRNQCNVNYEITYPLV